MEHDLEHLLGQTLAGWKLTHLLGAGGMAVVFRGENTLNRKLVRSIKIVRPEYADNPEFRARFATEAMLLERLHHPNVVRFYALREDRLGDEDYLVMELEYLEGHSLSTVLLRATVPPPLSEIARWMLEASEGVAAAHALGIIHRDLKPDNLFLTKQGAVKVLDFGVARAMDDVDRQLRMTRPGTVPGSPAYLAPEVCDGGGPGKATDVYALGISFAELLLGYHPYETPGEKPRTAPQMLFAHIHEPLPRLRSARPDAPASLEAFIAKATAKKPKDRFADAAEFAAVLGSLMEELSTPAGPAPIVRTEFAVPKMRSTPAPPETEAAPARGPRRARLAFVALALAGGLGVGIIASRFAREGARTTTPTPAPVPDAGRASTARVAADANDFVTIEAAPVGVLLGVPADAPADIRGFRPASDVSAPTYAFAIQSREVSWAELDPFVAEVPGFTRPDRVPADAAARARLPATGVPWSIARAYCRSLGGDLPTEEEWELAARGTALAPYPWGGTFRADGAHVFAGENAEVRPVATSPQDRRAVAGGALFDLAGNAREWTRDLYREDAPSAIAERDARLTFRAIRGLPLHGAPREDAAPPTTAHREALCADGPCPEDERATLREVGFRCVRPASSP